MSEIKALQQSLVADIRSGVKTPQEAVKVFEAVTPGQIRTGRIYEQKSVEDRRRQFAESKALRKEIRKKRIPFISKSFLPGMWLSQGLIVVGAESGRAKSTTASNVLAGFLRSVPGKSAIVVSNEEAVDAIYQRAACVLTKVDFIGLALGSISLSQEKEVEECVQDVIIPRVEVVEDGKFNMSYMEDVQAVLETAAIDCTGIVIIDYLQVITQSRSSPDLEPFQISKKLGIYLKDYGKEHGVPVVCFVQLGPGSEGSTMFSRVQNDKTFCNHSFLAIEIEPDFDTSTTKFRVHKDRFSGHTGKEIECDFVGGRYVFQGDESL